MKPKHLLVLCDQFLQLIWKHTLHLNQGMETFFKIWFASEIIPKKNQSLKVVHCSPKWKTLQFWRILQETWRDKRFALTGHMKWFGWTDRRFSRNDKKNAWILFIYKCTTTETCISLLLEVPKVKYTHIHTHMHTHTFIVSSNKHRSQKTGCTHFRKSEHARTLTGAFN